MLFESVVRGKRGKTWGKTIKTSKIGQTRQCRPAAKTKYWWRVNTPLTSNSLAACVRECQHTSHEQLTCSKDKVLVPRHLFAYPSHLHPCLASASHTCNHTQTHTHDTVERQRQQGRGSSVQASAACMRRRRGRRDTGKRRNVTRGRGDVLAWPGQARSETQEQRRNPGSPLCCKTVLLMLPSSRTMCSYLMSWSCMPWPCDTLMMCCTRSWVRTISFSSWGSCSQPRWSSSSYAVPVGHVTPHDGL